MKLTPIETTFLKLVLKEMRYLPVTELVGREVLINSIDTLASDIRSALSDTLPEIGELKSGSFGGTLAKYGLLDLSWSVPSSALESKGEVSIALLKEMGLLNAFESEDFEEFNELSLDGMPSNLRELVEQVGEIDEIFEEAFEYSPLSLMYIGEDLLEKQTVLRLFLQDKNYSIEKKLREKNSRRWLQLPPGYLPRALTITDACITNAPSLWFDKHFYW